MDFPFTVLSDIQSEEGHAVLSMRTLVDSFKTENELPNTEKIVDPVAESMASLLKLTEGGGNVSLKLDKGIEKMLTNLLAVI